MVVVVVFAAALLKKVSIDESFLFSCDGASFYQYAKHTTHTEREKEREREHAIIAVIVVISNTHHVFFRGAFFGFADDDDVDEARENNQQQQQRKRKRKSSPPSTKNKCHRATRGYGWEHRRSSAGFAARLYLETVGRVAEHVIE
jgi:hypothetical protein|tara:strand:- start:526 stop:960 length:435 start_codon:yes stop_codon:yes gene_type:complete